MELPQNESVTPKFEITQKLVGHNKSVLCLDCASPRSSLGGLLCSGSEDMTARIWDARQGSRAVKSLLGAKESVNSVAFYSHHRTQTDAPKQEDYSVFVASGKKILCFDLRNPSIVLKDSEALPEANEDEINQMSIKNDFLAACDDNGEVKIFKLAKSHKDTTVFKTLRRQHTNICSSVQFHPTKPWEIITSGLDCQSVLWDFSRAKSLYIFNTQTDNMQAQAEKQIVNPPFIFSHSISPDGTLLALGLGDHSVAIYHLPTKKRLLSAENHFGTVSQVTFPSFSNKHLISGGNDGKIVMWSLEELQEALLKSQQQSSKKKSAVKVSYNMSATLEIPHKSKINWLTTCGTDCSSICVGDQTAVISVYTIK